MYCTLCPTLKSVNGPTRLHVKYGDPCFCACVVGIILYVEGEKRDLNYGYKNTTRKKREKKKGQIRRRLFVLMSSGCHPMGCWGEEDNR